MNIFNVFRPKWKYGDSQVRLAAVGKLTNQGRLAKIALTDQDNDVRLSAVNRITEQTLLATIAKENGFRDCGLAAVMKLTDQKLLSNVAKENSSYINPVCVAAIERITDQGQLADIYMNAKDDELRMAAIRKISDQSFLADVAKIYRNKIIFETILAKLTDQKLLTDVAVMTEFGETCLEVVMHLTSISERLLAQKIIDIANTDHIVACHKDKLIAAIEKINHQDLLKDLALNGKNIKMRVVAAESITDNALLSELARNAKCDVVRMAAVRNINDQALLANIARDNEDFGIPNTVAKLIKDQVLLTDLAWNAKSVDVRVAAADKLADRALAQKLFCDVAMNVSYGSIAVNKITDQTLLSDLALNAKSLDVRVAAAKNLDDQTLAQKVFGEFAMNSGSRDESKAVLEKITNQTVLADLAQNANAIFVRLAAIDKLTDEGLCQRLLAHIAISEPLYKSIGPEFGDDGFSIPGSSVMAPAIGYEVLSKVTNQEQIGYIAKNAKHLDMRIAAVRNITEYNILDDLVKNADCTEVHQLAENRLANFDV